MSAELSAQLSREREELARRERAEREALYGPRRTPSGLHVVSSVASRGAAFEFVQAGEYDDLPDEVWAVPGLVPAGPCNGLLFGLSGGGKTFLALDLALQWCGLGPRSWFGRPFVADPQPVLYVLAEGGGRPFRQRIDAWLEHHGHSVAELAERGFWLVDPKVRGKRLPVLTDEGDMAEFTAAVLAREAQGHPRPGLVVFDTQRKLFGPGRKEDSADDGAAMMVNVERMSAELGAVLLTIAHPTKAARLQDGAEDPGSTPRGSGVYVDGSDFALRTLKGEDRMWVAKQKNGPTDFGLNFRQARDSAGVPVYDTNLSREEQSSRRSAAAVRRMVVAVRLALTETRVRSEVKTALRREVRGLQAADATAVLEEVADPAHRLLHLEGTGKAGSKFELAPHDDLLADLARELGPDWPDAPSDELDRVIDGLLAGRVGGLPM